MLEKANKDLAEAFNLSKGRVEVAILDNIQVYVINGLPSLFLKDNILYPTLVLLYKMPELLKYFKYVVVDEGAVPHIINGADVMVPGIIEYSNDIVEGDIVIVLDEKRRPLSVGVALMDSSDIGRLRKGKAVKNIHYFRDKLWDICISLISS